MYGAKIWTLRKVYQKVLKCGDEDQLDRSCDKWISVTHSQGEKGYLHTINRRKANWIGYILRGNCLLKQLLKERKNRSDVNTRKKT